MPVYKDGKWIWSKQEASFSYTDKKGRKQIVRALTEIVLDVSTPVKKAIWIRITRNILQALEEMQKAEEQQAKGSGAETEYDSSSRI